MASKSEAAGYWGPEFRICHALDDHGEPLYVSAKHVSCRKAVRVIREYWFGPDDEQTLIENSTGGTTLLHRFPGWRCFSGASAGGCTKGRHFAGYNFFYPRAGSVVSSRRAGVVGGCGDFGVGSYRVRSVERQRHVRCGVVRRLLRATYHGGGFRHTYPFHTSDGTPYGRATSWFRRGWRCTTGAGGAVCWNVARRKLNVIDTGGTQLLAITAEVG